jgi:hypothetical protein
MILLAIVVLGHALAAERGGSGIGAASEFQNNDLRSA